MKLLINLLLCLVPLMAELCIDGYRTIKLNREDNHFVTGMIRFILMITCSWCVHYFKITHFALHIILSALFHWASFNYIFNIYVINQRWNYLGSNLLDEFQKDLNPVFLLSFKVFLFIFVSLLVQFL